MIFHFSSELQGNYPQNVTNFPCSKENDLQIGLAASAVKRIKWISHGSGCVVLEDAYAMTVFDKFTWTGRLTPLEIEIYLLA